MEPDMASQSPMFELQKNQDNILTIIFHGRMDISNAPALLKQMTAPLRSIKSVRQLVIDFRHVTRLDDYGAMVVLRIMRILELQPGQLNFSNIDPGHEKTLSLIDFGQPDCRIKSRRSENFIIRLGESTLQIIGAGRFFIEFIGAMVVSVARVLKKPGSFRLNDTIGHMKTTGVDALPVVGLISFLMGLIMAFMSSLQLSQFGANIYVASLVALAMVSELGPIMTAIVVSGRSGSAYAAEISTMKISEEIDALIVMGFDPNLFLVLPRMIAAMAVIPILTIFSNIFAVAGGMAIGVIMLNLSPGAYITQTLESLTLFEIAWGLFKSLVFAVIISLTGCFRGLQAKGGASAVGAAATSAVVTSIFFIILFDSIFAVIRSYW
jgi:phospholipid/cholesterol/gamma-HCH transport system permease protein